MPRLLRSVLPICLAVAGACAPDDDLSPRPEPLAVVPANYCELTVDAFCAFYMRCGRMAAGSEAECHDLFLETCNGKYEPVYVALSEAGLLALSRSGLEACSAHLARVDCPAQVHDLDGACGDLWVGKQALGGPCGLGIESMVCAPGTGCVVDLSLCGVCKSLAAPGQPCGAEASCRADGFCDGSTCQPRGEPGAPCATALDCLPGLSCSTGTCTAPEFVGPGEACGDDRRCPYMTACRGTCQPQARLGEECSASTTCASGVCSSDGAGMSCTPLLQAGQACVRSGDCASGACARGLCGSIPGQCF